MGQLFTIMTIHHNDHVQSKLLRLVEAKERADSAAASHSSYFSETNVVLSAYLHLCSLPVTFLPLRNPTRTL